MSVSTTVLWLPKRSGAGHFSCGDDVFLGALSGTAITVVCHLSDALAGVSFVSGSIRSKRKAPSGGVPEGALSVCYASLVLALSDVSLPAARVSAHRHGGGNSVDDGLEGFCERRHWLKSMILVKVLDRRSWVAMQTTLR